MSTSTREELTTHYTKDNIMSCEDPYALTVKKATKSNENETALCSKCKLEKIVEMPSLISKCCNNLNGISHNDNKPKLPNATPENPDPLWSEIRKEIKQAVNEEPLLGSFLYETVLRHKKLEDVLAYHLSSKLTSATMDARCLMYLFISAYEDDPTICLSARADLLAHYTRDAACEYYYLPLLYFKGFHAIQCHRVAHWLWKNNRKILAYFLQNRCSEVFGIDIHPAAKIGCSIMLDHGSGVVIGETAVIGDGVSLLHGVTLGGSGKIHGDRHPKIGNGVMIGAGALVLGNIKVGNYSKIGAGSVVLEAVEPASTVVGVPAKRVGRTKEEMPADEMNQNISCFSDSAPQSATTSLLTLDSPVIISPPKGNL